MVQSSSSFQGAPQRNLGDVCNPFRMDLPPISKTDEYVANAESWLNAIPIEDSEQGFEVVAEALPIYHRSFASS